MDGDLACADGKADGPAEPYVPAKSAHRSDSTDLQDPDQGVGTRAPSQTVQRTKATPLTASQQNPAKPSAPASPSRGGELLVLCIAVWRLPLSLST